MQTRRLLIELDAPLAVSQSRDTANRHATPRIVPPTTLRGALAAALGKNGTSEDAMEKVFGPRGCRTSALMPSAPGRAGRAMPTPLTLRTCKRHGGFRSGGDPAGHGAEDLLFDALRFAEFGDADGLRNLRLCQAEGCDQVLEQMDGVLRAEGRDTFRTQPIPDTRAQAHVGLDRRRRGASAGMLYSREVISEKTSAGGELRRTQMQADVTGPDDVMDKLAEELSPGDKLRVGTARSRGLGTCRVRMFEQVGASDQIPGPPPLSDRIEQFNDRWQRHRDEAEGSGSKAGPLVSLTLETPALFVDDFLRPNLSPAPSDLLQSAFEPEKKHATALGALEKVHQIARPERVHSWNGMAEFPHRSRQGLAAGSVLVFRAEEQSEALFSALRHAEQAGIGQRRHFGFGRVRVCDPIHTHVHEHTSGSHE